MKREIKKLQNNHFDIVVIGGGIYGAWSAYDAALRGLKVALIEKNDFASGTSSASSKLIHGGLRYLETLQLSLVKKCLAERSLLQKLAPHLVQPIKFILPLYSHYKFNKLKIKCGLTLYDLLGKNISSPHKYYPIEEISADYPFLIKNGLICGYSYLDCKTDDARFVIEILKGAWSSGAVISNYTEVLEIVKYKDKISGVTVQDNETKNTFNIKADAVINTTGYHTSHLKETSELIKKEIYLTKGVHLVMPPAGIKDAFLFITKKDNRVFFCIPWYGNTLLGTTDTFCKNPDINGKVTKPDIEYLLNEANNYLSFNWRESDILGSFSGIRVLRGSNGETPSALSRDWEVLSPSPGLFISIGGKFTSSRIDAAKIVDAVCKYLKKEVTPSATSYTPLPSSPEDDYKNWAGEKIKEGETLGLDRETASASLRYGKAIENIFDIIKSDKSLKKRIHNSLPFCYAEIVHAATDEMALRLEDILRRRIPISILIKLEKDIMKNVENAAEGYLSTKES